MEGGRKLNHRNPWLKGPRGRSNDAELEQTLVSVSRVNLPASSGQTKPRKLGEPPQTPKIPRSPIDPDPTRNPHRSSRGNAVHSAFFSPSPHLAGLPGSAVESPPRVPTLVCSWGGGEAPVGPLAGLTCGLAWLVPGQPLALRPPSASRARARVGPGRTGPVALATHCAAGGQQCSGARGRRLGGGERRGAQGREPRCLGK